MKRSITLLCLFLVAALGLISCGAPSEPAKPAVKEGEKAAAKLGDPYKFGYSATLTGPAAVSYVATVEGIRVYFDELNARGGIDGHPVQFMIEDDRSDAGVAASIAKRFVESGAHGIIIASSSNVYAPIMAEAKKANIPVFTSGVGPGEAAPPNTQPLVFALRQMALSTDSRAIIHTISKLSPGKPKIGIATIDVPIAVALAQDAAKIAEGMGLEAIVKALPPTAVDYSPVADEFISKGVTAAYGSGPASVGVMLYEAMKRRGYQGTFFGLYDDPVILQERKDDKMYGVSFHTQPFQMEMPEHQALRAAGEKYRASSMTGYAVWGWAQARIIEAILKKTGWPVTSEKMLAVMNNFEFDGRPFQSPTKWTANDHLGWVYWGTYKWDAAAGKVVPAMEWWRVSSDGKTVEVASDMAAPAR